MFLQTNLEYLLHARRTNPSRLQQEEGIPQPTVHKILKGRSTNPRHDTLKKLADWAGVTVSDLVEKDLRNTTTTTRDNTQDLNPQPYDNNTSRIPKNARTVPIISTVQAGNWREAVEHGVLGYVMTFLDLSEQIFALRVEGDSMEPDFKPGDTLIIDTLVSPRPGGYVVALNARGEASFKKYRPRGVDALGEEIFELVPLNPDYAPMHSDREQISIIGTVVEHHRNLR